MSTEPKVAAMGDVPSEQIKEPIKISFGVKKNQEPVVLKTKSQSEAALDVTEASDNEEEEEEERAAKRTKLTHFESGTILEDVEDEEKKEPLVIPMLVDGRLKKLLEQEKDGSITDANRARLELLVASNPALAEHRKMVQSENHDEVAGTSTTEGEVPDYNQVPLGSFGLAILRGCGAEIGKNTQKVMTHLIEEKPKGLGVGATSKTVDRKKTMNDEGDECSQDMTKNDRDEVKKKDKRREDRDHGRRKDDDSEVWVRVDCRVRMISEGYEKGAYLDQKMRVVDVADRKNITLQDDDGRMHYNIRQSWLETVMPRNNGEKVIILRGPHSGAKGVMVDKDRERQTLQVSIIPTHEVVKVAFDDACMWTPQEVNLDDDE